VLTPLGRTLATDIEPVYLGLERLFSAEPTFRPEESTREFTILTTDYVLAAFGEHLSKALHAAAPRARLSIKVAKGTLPTDLPETLRAIDGIISAPKAEFKVDELRGQELFRDHWVCVVDASNPVPDRLTIADLERMPWVIPNHPDGEYPASSPLAPLLAQLPTRPTVAVRVDSYQATPYFVAGTDRVAVMQQRLALGFADRPDLRVLICPGAPPPIVEIFWWHHRNNNDAAHIWFRTLLTDTAEELGGIHAVYTEHTNRFSPEQTA
jgi:DNA-binding transcriptional LysR family regulator